MAEDLKRNGGFIPGVKPGKKTSEFLDNVLSRITLPGSVFLGIGCNLTGICDDRRSIDRLCILLRRNIASDYGRSYS